MSNYTQFAEHGCNQSPPSRTVLLLDASSSMELTDWPPSRLAGATEAALALVNVKASKYPDDHVGIVTFSDVVLILHPVAPVRWGENSLRAALTQFRTGPATAMTDGMIMAAKLLTDSPAATNPSSTGAGGVCAWGPHRANLASPGPMDQIILITDGEHNQGPDPVPYALEAKRAGIVIDVIGIGTPSGLDQTCLKAIASPRLDGAPRYCFIGDAHELCDKLWELAQHQIMPL